jgi:hypothetical protein
MPDIQFLADQRQKSLDAKRQSGEDLGHDGLLKALFWLWDAMDRAAMGFFLIGETGKSAKDDLPLHGTYVDVGVRKVEWISGGRNILDSFAGKPDWEDEQKAIYNYDGVPIHLHIYEDEPAIKQLTPIMYQHDSFFLPNPLDGYLTVSCQQAQKPTTEEIESVMPSKASETKLPFAEHGNLPISNNEKETVDDKPKIEHFTANEIYD